MLLPVYNAERYVAEAVESILAQTFTDFEFIIIDDGSTDGSLKVLQGYEKRDPRIRLISRANTGMVGALNEGLGLAVGGFVARMDADDVSLPERLERQVQFLRTHPSVVVLGTLVQLMDEKGRPIAVAKVAYENEQLQRRALAGFPPVCHATVMMRTDAVLSVGGYDEGMVPAEDLDLWLRLGELGELANLPQLGYRYRLHSNSVCATKQASQVRKWREACERAWERRGITGRFEVQGSWRPGADRHSRYAFAVRYGWMAFSEGHRQTAIAFAIKAVCINPLREPAWRLLVCSLIKRMRRDSCQR